MAKGIPKNGINTGRFKKGQTPHNKGVHTGNYGNGFKKGQSSWNKDKLTPEITREKQRQAKLKNPVRFWFGKKRLDVSGENNCNWNNGSSFEPYSIDWTKTLRISIRERDKYTCICGEKQGDYAFSVHHIDYNKKNCNPINLITLCRKCHLRTNYHREDWIEYFNNLIIKQNGN